MQPDSTAIVLVEDNSAIRMLLHEVFADEGFHVTCCPSAAAAIQTLQRLTPVLVISDMQMEHAAAGLHLLRHIRSSGPTAALPVIVYSADTLLLRTLRPKLEALSAVAVEKPFDVERLVRLAHRLIGAKEREVS